MDYSCILMTSFNLSYTLKAVSRNIVTLGVRVSTHNFAGKETSTPQPWLFLSLYVSALQSFFEALQARSKETSGMRKRQ